MGLTVLIVDDDPASLKMVGRYLLRLGFEVHEKEAVVSAIESLQKQTFDVLITDKNMPDPEGGDEGGMLVLKAARELQPRCQVIMMTGYATVETALQALRLGAFDYIQKPFTLVDLKQKIDRISAFHSFINSDKTLTVYHDLRNEILKFIKAKTHGNDRATELSLKAIEEKIDLFFRATTMGENFAQAA